MELPAQPVLDLLAARGVTEVFHAATVCTAGTFIGRMQILSQGTMARLGLRHSPQTSDPVDRQSGIFFDVFLSLVDIHQAARRPNVYGPVLFALSLEHLRQSDMSTLWITKSNPIHWPETPQARNRWFASLKELEAGLDAEGFDHMLAVRCLGGILPMRDGLTRIVVDDPMLEHPAGVPLFAAAYGALAAAAGQSGSKAVGHIVRRTCPRRCGCLAGYQEDHEQTLKLFQP